MHTAEVVDVAGILRGPENLYDNVTKGILSTTTAALPAKRGEVQGIEAELAEYKSETTTLINSLVDKVNSLTPVGTPPCLTRLWS